MKKAIEAYEREGEREKYSKKNRKWLHLTKKILKQKMATNYSVK